MMELTVPEDRTSDRVAVAQGHCHCSFDVFGEGVDGLSKCCRGVPTGSWVDRSTFGRGLS